MIYNIQNYDEIEFKNIVAAEINNNSSQISCIMDCINAYDAKLACKANHEEVAYMIAELLKDHIIQLLERAGIDLLLDKDKDKDKNNIITSETQGETDMAMDIKDFLSTCIVDVVEFNREVKVPQEKAAPIIKTNKVVRVFFSDSAVIETEYTWDETDKYDLKRAIEICILKYLLGGTKEYNAFFDKEIKKHNKRTKTKEKIRKMEQESKEADERAAVRRRKRYEKRQAKARQEQIDIQTEAYLKALRQHEIEQLQSKTNTDYAQAELTLALNHFDEADGYTENGHA